jgi:hypothetical protein
MTGQSIEPKALAAGESSAPAQSFLFSDDQLKEIMEAEEAKGVYTAERLVQRRPDTYKAIVELLAEGRSHRYVETLLGVARRTIGAVEDREPEAIKARRDQRIKNLNRAADYQIDRLVDHPDLVPMQFAADTAVKLSTHAQLLSGQATARVEHNGRVDIFADWEQIIERQLQPGSDVIELDPITPDSGQKEGAETDLVGGKKFPIAQLEDRDPDQVIEAETDSRSDDSGDRSRQGTERDTDSVTDRAASTPHSNPESERLESAQPGGAGGSLAGSGRPISITRHFSVSAKYMLFLRVSHITHMIWR